jgi:HUS1 checkpoint protein
VVLFEEEGYKCQSRYNNQIAFSVDIVLLLKVLRAAVAHDADALEVKLAMRSIPCTTGVLVRAVSLLQHASLAALP